MTRSIKRLAGYGRDLPARWTTVALFAIALAYIDGFWLTALQGAVGAVERIAPPPLRWLRDSTLMLPLVFLAVLLALLWARRWFAPNRPALVGLGAATLLITCISGGLSIAQAAANAAYNYSFQTQHLELLHSYGANQSTSGGLAGLGTATSLSYSLYCNLRGVAAGSAVAQLEYMTLMTHVRALYVISALLLITNLVIAAVLLVMLKDRLWSTRLAASPLVNELNNQAAVGAALV